MSELYVSKSKWLQAYFTLAETVVQADQRVDWKRGYAVDFQVGLLFQTPKINVDFAIRTHFELVKTVRSAIRAAVSLTEVYLVAAAKN